jgi:hypothetical protein
VREMERRNNIHGRESRKKGRKLRKQLCHMATGIVNEVE